MTAASVLPPGRRPALIVNEVQRGVLDPDLTSYAALAAEAAARDIVARIAALAAAFRTHGLPVIHTPVVHRQDMAGVVANSMISATTLKRRSMLAGSDEAAFCAPLRPEPGDHVIDRPAGLIGFVGTNLDATLRRLGVDTVVLVGVSTNVAIPGNTMVAVDLGYHVVIPEDCIAGSDPVAHRTIIAEQLRLLARMTTAEMLVAALETAA